jgi:hypothetical protein
MNGDSYNENSGPNKTVGDLESYRPLVAAFKEARALYDTGASGGRERETRLGVVPRYCYRNIHPKGA